MQNNLNENSLAHIWHLWNLEKRETQKLTKKHYNYIVAYGHNKTHVKICKNPISFIIQKVTLENAAKWKWNKQKNADSQKVHLA